MSQKITQLPTIKVGNKTITIQQYSNLLRMAEYLLELPQNRFDMNDFLSPSDESFQKYEHECGSVGCVIGHATEAIEPRIAGEDWLDYADRMFGLCRGREHVWCFTGYWAFVDNTPIGAAKRIRYLLQRGIPDHFNFKDAVKLYADL